MTPENRNLFFHYAISQMPREACGVVIIERGTEVLVPCRNVTEIETDFAIDPIDYARAEKRGDVVRIVHSHCHVSPMPSEADKISCETTKLPWSIVSVPGGSWYDFEPSGYKAPLIGREWMHGILDCYSLIRDYYLEVLKIEIPDFERRFEWWLKGENLYQENFEKAGFIEIPLKEIRPGDVILFQIRSPVINHGAIYLGNDQILHHLHRRLSCRELLGGFYSKSISKILRYRHETNHFDGRTGE